MFSNPFRFGPARWWLPALCIAAAVFTAQGAHAQARPDQERVRTDGLDLTTRAGRDTLDRRIRAAARRVCSRAAFSGGIAESMEIWRCTRTTVADAAPARLKAITRAAAERQAERTPRIALIRVIVLSQPTPPGSTLPAYQ